MKVCVSSDALGHYQYFAAVSYWIFVHSKLPREWSSHVQYLHNDFSGQHLADLSDHQTLCLRAVHLHLLQLQSDGIRFDSHDLEPKLDALCHLALCPIRIACSVSQHNSLWIPEVRDKDLCCRIKKLIDRVHQAVFFRVTLRTLLEGYIELTLCASINLLHVRDFS